MSNVKKVILVVFITLFIAVMFVSIYFTPKAENKIFLKAVGKEIKYGDETIVLKGVNAGGWLVQEEWMNPTKMVDQVTLISTLAERFGKDKTNDLLDAYHRSWWSDEDFANIKKLGFNCIRLPFTYLILYDEEYKLKDNAFHLIDWFVEKCKALDLYVVLDLHGAIGSQNGSDHSGNTWGKTNVAKLFLEDDYKQKTIQLWQEVASRYKDETAIAAYDLLNEPTGGEDGRTNITQWMFYNDLYKAIRAIDQNHIIMIESVWDTENLPEPRGSNAFMTWDWTNVIYQYHHYCWEGINDYSLTKEFIDRKVKDIKELTYEVPIFIGEFTGFELEANWNSYLESYAKEGYSYTIWTYKVIGKDSSWGLYTSDMQRVDPQNDSYDQILSTWSNLNTSKSFKENEKIIGFISNNLIK